ncbi:MAG TPA: respiratory nitrate reductase subunit gamma, partial [Candidatus Methylomirabilis sp.]|nr:respiratory nitrate reductase subunit gamma [Candidatus Methylomirabilis sp.]
MTLMAVFWILIPLFVGALFAGLYRNLFMRLAVIFGASGRFISLRTMDAGAFGQAYTDEVMLQRRIRQRGRFPWTRHMLISWGFSVLFLFDLLTALLTKYLPSEPFMPGHVGWLFLKFGLNLSGMTLLIGLALALGRAVTTSGTEEAKFNDTPGTLFLLAVVVTGFMAEAMHFANLPPDPRRAWALLGHWMAEIMRGGAPYGGSYSVVWIAHALLASAFLAYLGWSRMIHVFAAPLGRLFYAQPALREGKIRGVMEGL